MSKCRGDGGGGSERCYLAGWRGHLLRRGCSCGLCRRAGRRGRAGVPHGRRAAARGAAQEGVAEGAAPRERRSRRRHRERQGGRPSAGRAGGLWSARGGRWRRRRGGDAIQSLKPGPVPVGVGSKQNWQEGEGLSGQ